MSVSPDRSYRCKPRRSWNLGRAGVLICEGRSIVRPQPRKVAAKRRFRWACICKAVENGSMTVALARGRGQSPFTQGYIMGWFSWKGPWTTSVELSVRYNIGSCEEKKHRGDDHKKRQRLALWASRGPRSTRYSSIPRPVPFHARGPQRISSGGSPSRC